MSLSVILQDFSLKERYQMSISVILQDIMLGERSHKYFPSDLRKFHVKKSHRCVFQFSLKILGKRKGHRCVFQFYLKGLGKKKGHIIFPSCPLPDFMSVDRSETSCPVVQKNIRFKVQYLSMKLNLVILTLKNFNYQHFCHLSQVNNLMRFVSIGDK